MEHATRRVKIVVFFVSVNIVAIYSSSSVSVGRCRGCAHAPQARPTLVNPTVRDVQLYSSTQMNHSFNYLPWEGNDTQLVTINGLKLDNQFNATTPISTSMVLGISHAQGNIFDPPYVVLYGPSLFSLDNVTLLNPGHFELAFPKEIIPGTYEMHVIIYKSSGSKRPYGIHGTPFVVTFTPSQVQNMPREISAIDTPYCNFAYSSSQKNGRWIRAPSEHQIQGISPRSGWIWRPQTCQMQMHAIWKLPCLKNPIWIVIMGTSTTRGLFFAALDLIFTELQLQELNIMNMWKCWGFLDFRVGNFRISYRDFRFHYADNKLSAGYREFGVEWLHQNVCPRHLNTSSSKHYDYGVPDFIVVESPEVLRKQSSGCLEEYENNGGVFIGMSHKPRSSEIRSFVNVEPSDAYERVGRPFIDVYPMARPLYNNDRSSFDGRDIHYAHTGHCFQQSPKAIHVCSTAIEMELFMVLHVIGQARPGIFDSMAANCTRRRHSRKAFTLCKSCPKSFGHWNKDGERNTSCFDVE